MKHEFDAMKQSYENSKAYRERDREEKNRLLEEDRAAELRHQEKLANIRL